MGAAINSIQKLDFALSGTTGTQTITSVDTAKTIVYHQTRSNNATTNRAKSDVYLSSATEISWQRRYSGNTTNLTVWVVEYDSTVSVQRGEITGSGATQTATITSVATDRSIVINGGNGFHHGADTNANAFKSLELTNATTVTVYPSNHLVYEERWEVIEFPAGTSVQRGTVTVDATSKDTTITSVDTAKSVVSLGYTISANPTDQGDRFIDALLTSGTNLRITKDSTNQTQTAYWQVIEVDNWAVQSGQETLIATDSTNAVTITSVDTAASYAIGIQQAGCAMGGQGQGDSTIVLGSAGERSNLATLDLSAATTLDVTRLTTTYQSKWRWQVVEVSAAVPVTGTGTYTAPTQDISGTGSIIITGTGTLSNAAPTLSGTGSLGLFGTGTHTNVAPTFSGTGTLIITGTGTFATPAPTFAGTGGILIDGTGTVTNLAPEFSGAGAIGAISGNGTYSQPFPTFSGTASITITGTGALTIIPPTFSGTGIVGHIGTGTLEIAFPTFSGTGVAGAAITGTGTIEPAFPTFSSSGTIIIIGSGSFTIEFPTMSGQQEILVVPVLVDAEDRVFKVPFEQRFFIVPKRQQ